ncbi:MAG: metallophosphoesterase, partial [Flavobacteriales bacterium]|nr:metallophosphoesterase [Flavobacteriales bacterium]
ATLLANIDTINSLGANLFLSTGDLFMDPVNDLSRYQKAFFSKLKMPFFNAPGNHDLTGSGPSKVMLPHGKREGWMFLTLNSEASDGSIGLEQIAFMEAESQGVDNLFIISHRPIWAEEDPQYSPLFQGNTRSVLGTNFKKDVYPLLEQIAKHAHVYWISGSMGGTAQSSIFFQQHAPNITFIQSAIRNEPRDALLIADVYPDTVKWSALSLTGQKLLAPEAYDAAWWKARLGHTEGFNWKLLPYLVKTTVLHRAFWWGAGLMLLLVLLVRRILRR